MEEKTMREEWQDNQDIVEVLEKILTIVADLDHDTAVKVLASAINECLFHRGYTAYVVIKPLASLDWQVQK